MLWIRGLADLIWSSVASSRRIRVSWSTSVAGGDATAAAIARVEAVRGSLRLCAHCEGRLQGKVEIGRGERAQTRRGEGER